ncbi:hypothetical protein FHY13_000123 [Xanthomonas arboricola]|nr:hypothetical protein [Xanthomonas euroxanthea]MBB3811817.1 hypothetical protein [Xanthomonas euroxanthea]
MLALRRLRRLRGTRTKTMQICKAQFEQKTFS